MKGCWTSDVAVFWANCFLSRSFQAWKAFKLIWSDLLRLHQAGVKFRQRPFKQNKFKVHVWENPLWAILFRTALPKYSFFFGYLPNFWPTRHNDEENCFLNLKLASFVLYTYPKSIHFLLSRNSWRFLYRFSNVWSNWAHKSFILLSQTFNRVRLWVICCLIKFFLIILRIFQSFQEFSNFKKILKILPIINCSIFILLHKNILHQ